MVNVSIFSLIMILLLTSFNPLAPSQPTSPYNLEQLTTHAKKKKKGKEHMMEEMHPILQFVVEKG